MYTFLRSLTPRQRWLEQAPVLASGFVTAEAFYKFHSFALECAAFLATWFVLDAMVSVVRCRRADLPDPAARASARASAPTKNAESTGSPLR